MYEMETTLLIGGCVYNYVFEYSILYILVCIHMWTILLQMSDLFKNPEAL